MASLHQAFHGVPRRVGKPYNEKDIGRDLSWIKNVAESQREVARRVSAEERIEIKRCPVCAAEEHVPFFTIYRFEYARCVNCGHYFISSPPRPSTTAKLYEGEEDLRCCQHLAYNEETFQRRLEAISRPKAAFVTEHVQPSPSNAVWIDIGCALGELLTAALEQGWQVRGIEADAAQARIARQRGFDVVEAYVTPDNAKRFLEDAAVVSIINVLEHIPDPLELLCSISKGVRQGTYLVAEVPRQPSLGAFSNLVFPGLVYRQFCAPDHLHLFTENSFEISLRKAQFEPVAIWVFGKDGIDFLSQAALQIANLSEATTSFVEQILDWGTHQLQQCVDQSGLSDTLFVIAKKSPIDLF